MHRLFIAIRPPEEVRRQLLALMSGLPGLRWQNDNQLHLTLRFIGEVERPMAEDIAAELNRLSFPRFSIALAGVGQFEKDRRGALWAGVKPTDQLKTLNAKVERVCQSAGLTAERRTFYPHITLARWKGRVAGIDSFIESHGGLASEPWQVGTLTLFESRLGRDGAHYEPVAEYALAAALT